MLAFARQADLPFPPVCTRRLRSRVASRAAITRWLSSRIGTHTGSACFTAITNSTLRSAFSPTTRPAIFTDSTSERDGSAALPPRSHADCRPVQSIAPHQHQVRPLDFSPELIQVLRAVEDDEPGRPPLDRVQRLSSRAVSRGAIGRGRAGTHREPAPPWLADQTARRADSTGPRPGSPIRCTGSSRGPRRSTYKSCMTRPACPKGKACRGWSLLESRAENMPSSASFPTR